MAETRISNSDVRRARRRRAALILAGVAAGALLLTPRRWLTTNDVTTGATPEYPDLQPQRFDRAAADVFEAARRATRHMARWKVVHEEPEARRIVAEARTFVLGFTDDVTVWVEPDGSACRVFVRSRSRIGRGDLGENARSIRALQRMIAEEIRLLDRPGRAGKPDPGVTEMPADEGTGPLLQRDYTGRIAGTDWSPEEVILMLRSDIERLSAPELAKFERPPRDSLPLKVGDFVEVDIKGAGETHVRVIHVDNVSLTFRSMGDHIEAGRITFAAWREGELLIFHIRSRARQAGAGWLLGFLMGGIKMQAKIWETFIGRVAEVCGGRLVGEVQIVTRTGKDDGADRGEVDAPTLRAPADVELTGIADL